MKEQQAQQGDPTSRFCRWCKGWKKKLKGFLVCRECDLVEAPDA